MLGILIVTATFGAGDPGDGMCVADQDAAVGPPLGVDVDVDCDGLGDTSEVLVHGSEPYDDDSDSDGVKDGDEVHIHGTGPMDADTDDDGYTDGQEVNSLGSDPTDFCDPGCATAVSVGWRHRCVLTTRGDVECNGSGSHGADYDGGDALGVAAGGDATCILVDDGSPQDGGDVFCYGDFTHTYAGGDAVALDAGFDHACLLTSRATVDCFGPGNKGQAADYTAHPALHVSTGHDHTCVVYEDATPSNGGNVACYGALFGGKTAPYLGGDAVAVAAGGVHSCALLSNGNIRCWGYTGPGHPGVVRDYTNGDAVAVAAGYDHACALLSNGNVDCWGSGGGPYSADYFGGDAVSLDLNTGLTCAVVTRGAVDCWPDFASADWPPKWWEGR